MKLMRLGHLVRGGVRIPSKRRGLKIVCSKGFRNVGSSGGSGNS